MESKRVLFIKIPKTASQSITRALYENNYSLWHIEQIRLLDGTPISESDFKFGKMNIPDHIPLSAIENNFLIEKDAFRFSVVRNPFKRAYSYYKHTLRMNNMRMSFYNFILNILDKRIYENTPMTPFTQSYYLLNKDGIIKLDKIYRFENLSDLEKDFNISLPHINSTKFNENDYKLAYSNPAIINFVKQIYMQDFVNFNYSTNFEDSLL